MGSFSATKIDGLELWGASSYADKDSLSIFQEHDRRITPYRERDEDEEAVEYRRYEYAVSAPEMRDRLDALGFTVEQARASYERHFAAHVELYGEWVSDGSCLTTAEEVSELKKRDFDWWCAALAKLIPLGWNTWHRDAFKRIPESEAMHDMEGIDTFFYDNRLLLRAALFALKDAKEVTLDVSHLVDGGYYHESEAICEDARYVWSQTDPVYGPIVILTEGKLDSRVLSRAFEVMSPHLVDFFGFLDFDGVALPGSAETLAKLVRAFVGARLSSRMIAVFDNDTAGWEAMESLRSLKLPPNIKTAALPNSQVAASYPTEGPQGVAVMDVNGLAGSIEMYLGRAALTGDNGELRPVRWTGFNQKLRRYQGAVENKGGVQDAFFDQLAKQATPEGARATFPDLAAVLDMISFMFGKRGNDALVAEGPQSEEKEQD